MKDNLAKIAVENKGKIVIYDTRDPDGKVQVYTLASSQKIMPGEKLELLSIKNISKRYKSLGKTTNHETSKHATSEIEENIKEFVSEQNTKKYKLDNYYEFITTSRDGLRYSEFVKTFKKYELSFKEWANILEMSDRTLIRYKTDNKRFDSLQTEKIIELDRLFNFGVSVFASKEKFLSWIERDNSVFGNQKPKDLFDTSFGIELLNNELQNIEYLLFV